MGGAVLAQAYAVVGEHEDGGRLHQGRQADGRAHIVREDQEGGAEGDQPAVQGEAVHYGGHAVLADAEVQGALRFLEEIRLVGRAQVGRAAGEAGQRVRYQIDHLAGGLAGGHGLLEESGGGIEQPLGDLAAQHGLGQLGFFGHGGGVILPELQPALAVFLAGRGLLRKARAGLFGDEERFFGGPAQGFLGGQDLGGLERLAVHAAAVLLGAAEADMGLHDYHRGLFGLALGFLYRGVDLVEVIAVLHFQNLPVLRLEALFHILVEGNAGGALYRDAV